MLVRYFPAEFRCRCGYSEPLEMAGICRGAWGTGWTEALARYVTRHSWDTTDELRLRTGLPNSRIQSLRRPPSEQPAAPAAIDVLGIDELYLDRRRFAVITDITARRLLRFVPVATTIDGLSDRIQVRDVLTELPTPRVVTLDMNPTVLQTVREVWPEVRVLIDKRHALRTADRAFSHLIGFILNRRLDRDPGATGPFFGEAAFQRHRLMHLVTKRSASCTAVDIAQWHLIRLEEPKLWQAYLFREQLYDLLSFQTDAREFRNALVAWQVAVRDWLKQLDLPLRQQPMTAALVMMTQFTDSLALYIEDRATNAFTEFVNSRLRERARRGRRYRPEALIALVNEELQAPAAQNRIAPASLVRRSWTTERLPPVVPDESGEDDSVGTVTPDVVARPELPLTADVPVSPKRPGRRADPKLRPHHARWPSVVESWLTSGLTRRRKRLEADLAGGAPPEERAAWLLALRTPAQPLPAELEQHVLLEYLRSQPGPETSGMSDALDLLPYLTTPESLPAIARPYVTVLARAAIEASADQAAWAAICSTFRRYDRLRTPQDDNDLALILSDIDDLRRQLTGLASYRPVHSHLLRLNEARLPGLLTNETFRWAIAASPFERDRGNMAALANFSLLIVRSMSIMKD